MDAAVEVFAERGFYNARVSEVAEAAGVAGGTIYLYFKNKDDLLICLFEEHMDQIVSYARRSLEGIEDPSLRLKSFIDRYLQWVMEQPGLAEVLTVELRQSSKFMREYKPKKLIEFLGIINDLYTYGRDRGAFRPDVDPKVFQRILFGSLDELSVFWVSCRRKGVPAPYDLHEVAEDVFKICIGGVATERHS